MEPLEFFKLLADETRLHSMLLIAQKSNFYVFLIFHNVANLSRVQHRLSANPLQASAKILSPFH